VRIGVIGTGWWSTQFHLPGLTSYDQAEVVALADPNRRKLDAAGDAFGIGIGIGGAGRYEDYRDLLAAGDVAGVVIAVPHVYHYEIARAALDAGVSVMLEKPMTLSSADAWDLVRVADERGLHLVVGYTFQFTDHARRAREIVQSGALGTVNLISGQFSSMVQSYLEGRPDDYQDAFGFPMTGPDPSTYSDPAVSGGGQGQTQVTHPMGMVFWVTGCRAVEVHAWMAAHGAAVDMVDAIAYRLDNGGLGTMASSGQIHPGQRQVEHIVYHGTKGVMVQDLSAATLDVSYADGTSERVESADVYPAAATGRCLVDLLAGADEVVNRAPGAAAAATVEFLEAAYQSAAKGAPVLVDDTMERH
jgi:predicted dehydrogenase